jgi:hypothetical protein
MGRAREQFGASSFSICLIALLSAGCVMASRFAARPNWPSSTRTEKNCNWRIVSARRGKAAMVTPGCIGY